MARLLLVTCGDTDLRAVVKDGDGEALALLAAPTRRALHQKLLDNEIEHVIDDTAAGMAQTEKDVFLTERGLVLAAEGIVRLSAGLMSARTSSCGGRRALACRPAKGDRRRILHGGMNGRDLGEAVAATPP